METIKIGEKEFEFRLTIESWKKLNEVAEIRPNNIEQKIESDMAGTISLLVFYGLSPEDRKTVTQDFVDSNIDLSIAGRVTEIIQKSMKVEETDDDKKNS